MLNSLNGDMYVCISIDSRKDHHTNTVNVPFPTKPKDTGNLHHILIIKIGAQVMLTMNVDISDGLTNGATETVKNVTTRSSDGKKW